jgi:hypothetical protein
MYDGEAIVLFPTLIDFMRKSFLNFQSALLPKQRISGVVRWAPRIPGSTWPPSLVKGCVGWRSKSSNG